MNWPRLFRRLAKEYGWTPEQVGRLTLPQMEALLEDEDEDRACTYADIQEAAREAREMKAAEKG